MSILDRVIPSWEDHRGSLPPTSVGFARFPLAKPPSLFAHAKDGFTPKQFKISLCVSTFDKTSISVGCVVEWRPSQEAISNRHEGLWPDSKSEKQCGRRLKQTSHGMTRRS